MGRREKGPVRLYGENIALTAVSFIFLMATITIELVSFLTTHAMVSIYDPAIREGLWRECIRPTLSISNVMCVWKNFVKTPELIDEMGNTIQVDPKECML